MPDYVALPARNGTCRTCGGRIHHYPLAPGAVQTSGNNWAHINTGDWIGNPHTAEPKEEA